MIRVYITDLYVCIDSLFFFFSSRRRHTRCLSDWSSDVCSSDLSSGAPLAAHPIMPMQVARRRANPRRGSRLDRREKRRRTVNFNDELDRALEWRRAYNPKL